MTCLLVLATAVRLMPMVDPIVVTNAHAAALQTYRAGSVREVWYGMAPYPAGAGNPGYGYPSKIEPYAADEELKAELAKRPGLEAHWFRRNPLSDERRVDGSTLESDIQWLKSSGRYADAIPFLLFRPKTNSLLKPWQWGREVPLVVFMPGCGEQGTDLKLQFRQRACIDTVTSEAFQENHPCWLLVPMPPEHANCNIPHGYPTQPRAPLITLFNDLVLKVVEVSEEADAPTIDRSRLYLTGLGSGGTLAAAMAFDHPGRYAAVMPIWSCPHVEPAVHPDAPGAWWYGWKAKSWQSDEAAWYRKMLDGFAARVKELGGDFVIRTYPAPTSGWWWDAVWTADEFWDWCCAKTSEKEVEVSE